MIPITSNRLASVAVAALLCFPTAVLAQPARLRHPPLWQGRT